MLRERLRAEAGAEDVDGSSASRKFRRQMPVPSDEIADPLVDVAQQAVNTADVYRWLSTLGSEQLLAVVYKYGFGLPWKRVVRLMTEQFPEKQWTIDQCRHLSSIALARGREQLG